MKQQNSIVKMLFLVFLAVEFGWHLAATAGDAEINQQRFWKRLILSECHVGRQDISTPAELVTSIDPITTNETTLIASEGQTEKPPPDEATKVFAVMNADRFLSLNDVEESFSIIASIHFSWYIPCISELAKRYPQKPPLSSDYLFIGEEDEFWYPALVHRNSKDDPGMVSNLHDYTRLHFRTGQMIYAKYGMFNSLCILDLLKFPFDTQECSINVSLWYVREVVRFAGSKLKFIRPYDFTSKNSGWELIDGTAFTQDPPDFFGDGYFESVIFSFHMRRRPEFFLNAVWAPAMLLVAVQLASFFLPPELPDRTAFAMTVLLSFAVLQTQVTSSIPKTPEHLYVNDYMLVNLVATAFSTIQSAAMCFFMNVYPNIAKRRISLFCKRQQGTANMSNAEININKVLPLSGQNSDENGEQKMQKSNGRISSRHQHDPHASGIEINRWIDIVSVTICFIAVFGANMTALLLSIYGR